MAALLRRRAQQRHGLLGVALLALFLALSLERAIRLGMTRFPA